MKKSTPPWSVKGVTLVDFSAPWCGPCKSQKPVLNELRKSYNRRVDITEVNIDANRDLAVKLGVQSIPTLVVFKDGDEVKRFVGFQSGSVLSKAIDEALA